MDAQPRERRMGRPRKNDLDFPLRVQARRGKFYYTTGTTWIPLGADRDAAFKAAEVMNAESRERRLAALSFEREASAELRRTIFGRDGSKCVYCGATEGLCLDHVIPASAGGATSERNMVVSCESCNGAKSDFDLADFMVKLHKVFERYLAAHLP